MGPRPQTSDADGYGELAKLTTTLERSGKYRLMATGPYDDSKSSSYYAIWERTSPSPAAGRPRS